MSYSSHFLPSFFWPKHLGKSALWKVKSSPCACSQNLHLATVTAADAAAAAMYKHKTTQDGELALPDGSHKILISHNRSAGLGICPTWLKPPLSLPLYVVSVWLKVHSIQGGNSNWICTVTKSWGIVFTSVCQRGMAEWGAAQEEFQPSGGAERLVPFPLPNPPTHISLSRCLSLTHIHIFIFLLDVPLSPNKSVPTSLSHSDPCQTDASNKNIC